MDDYIGLTCMAKNSRRSGAATGSGNTTKYDAHHRVLAKAYGAQADLRRELADSKAAVAERTEILNIFADCNDPQRAWLLLEDYFEKLSLSRKDFTSQDWWPPASWPPRARSGWKKRPSFFCAPAGRCPPNCSRTPICGALPKSSTAKRSSNWCGSWNTGSSPPPRPIWTRPRAIMRVACQAKPVSEDSALHGLCGRLSMSLATRTGEKAKTLG